VHGRVHPFSITLAPELLFSVSFTLTPKDDGHLVVVDDVEVVLNPNDPVLEAYVPIVTLGLIDVDIGELSPSPDQARPLRPRQNPEPTHTHIFFVCITTTTTPPALQATTRGSISS